VSEEPGGSPVRILLRATLVSIGLLLCLGPALRAPVVLGADGRTDLGWAREGTGLWKPLQIAPGEAPHALKPGYLLFLRLATAALPAVGEPRAVVVVQTLLLWLAVAGAALAVARRHGGPAGISVWLVLLSFLPLHIAAANVLPEAIASAVVLVLVFVVSDGKPTAPVAATTALLLTLLFWIRPNSAGIVGLVLLVRWLTRREARTAFVFAGVALGAITATWLATRSVAGPDAARALPDAVLFGSAEYSWTPTLDGWVAGASPKGISKLEGAAENWSRWWHSPPTDRDRELVWRMFHGILGLEYDDPRWSTAWRLFDHAGRVLAPLLVLAAFAILLTAADREARLLGWLGLAALVLQDLAVGSGPRYAVPILPVFLSLAAIQLFAREGRGLRPRAIALFLVFVGAVAIWPQAASLEWGVIERAGVVIEERIPRRALPSAAPATLHVRIAPPEPHMDAGLAIELGGRVRYRSAPGEIRRRPVLTIPLTAEDLAADSAGPLTLRLVSDGIYGPFSFLLFPVVPTPWRRGARRADSPELSPESDIPAGGLVWWAHAGSDDISRAASTSVRAGKSVVAIRENAASTAYAGP